MSAYSQLVNDYYDGYMVAYNCRNKTATYLNGVEIPVEELEESLAGQAIKHGWFYGLSCKCWYRENVRFKHLKYWILKIFNYGEYSQLDVRNKVVIDVGAYVGDSAIYFALKGAKKVIAIEPHPGAYAEMLININLNKLVDRIIPINAGLASRPGKICPQDFVKNTIGYYKPNMCEEGIPIITLAEVLRQYGDNDDMVLKMDCEGCEYDVILNNYDNVNKFNEIYFEYHAYKVNKPVDVLLEKLSGDFTCSHVFIDNYYHIHNMSIEDRGIIKCERKK
jgi:FkbM family methyltransferase